MALRKHLIAYLAPNLAQAIASFGTVAILTRWLSAAEYGRFTLVFTVATIAHYLILTWCEAAASRFYAKAKEDGATANHFTTLLACYAINAFIFAIVAVFIILFYPVGETTRMALAAAFAGSIVRSLLKIALETRRMDLQANRFAMIDSFHVLVGFALTIVGVIAFGFKENGPFIAVLVASIMALLFEAPALWKSAKGGQFNKSLAVDYFKFGYPISIGLILAIILNTGDRFLIAGLLGEAEVGAYSAGYQVAARILEIIFLWASSATFPLLVNAYESGDLDKLRVAANNSFSVRFGLGAPCALGIALVSPSLCELLIGPEMRETATRIAPWIALGGLLAGLSDYFSDAFMLSRKVVERAVLMLIPTALNIILNLIFLPKWGIMGAVVSTIAAFGLGLVILAIRSRRHVILPLPLDQIIKVCASCAVMAIVVCLIPRFGGILELVIKGGVGALCYGIMAIWLNLAGLRDRLQSRFAKAPIAQNDI